MPIVMLGFMLHMFEDKKINLNYIEEVNYKKEIEDEINNIYKQTSIFKNCLREKIYKILGA